jgi:hypothetical protein
MLVPCFVLQGLLSDARVLALGPKFMSLYICKFAMERRIYYEDIEGVTAEWFEATGTLVLDISSSKNIPQRRVFFAVCFALCSTTTEFADYV